MQFAGGILSGVAQARQQAHAEVLAERLRAQAQQHAVQMEQMRLQGQSQRDIYQNFVQNQRDERNHQQQRELMGERQTFERQQTEDSRAYDRQQGGEFLRAAGVGQPGADFYLNPNSQPQTPELPLHAAQALVANQRMREQAAATNEDRDAMRAATDAFRNRQLDETVRYHNMPKGDAAPLTPEEENSRAENVMKALNATGVTLSKDEALAIVRSRKDKIPVPMPTADKTMDRSVMRMGENDVTGLRAQRRKLETDAQARVNYAMSNGIDPDDVKAIFAHIDARIKQASGSMTKTNPKATSGDPFLDALGP